MRQLIARGLARLMPKAAMVVRGGKVAYEPEAVARAAHKASGSAEVIKKGHETAMASLKAEQRRRPVTWRTRLLVEKLARTGAGKRVRRLGPKPRYD